MSSSRSRRSGTSTEGLQPSVSERLVELLLRRFEAADGELLAGDAARSLLDFACCVRGGRAVVDAVWAGPDARLAVEAHALDRDDLHGATLTHPGGVVWPAVAAAARKREVAGRDAVAAAALGFELTAAIARLLGPGARRYWHSTALAGTVGAAGAAAAAGGADPAAVARAVGHAISVAGGSIEAMIERSGTRLLHRAHAVSTGIACAEAAVAGLDATRLGLESPNGLLAALGSDVDAASAFDAPAGLAIAETGQRYWATSGFAQGAVDAARSLGPIPPAEIEAIVVAVSPGAVALAGNAHPASDAEAWWSVQHAVCVSLSSAAEAALEHGLSRDPEIVALLPACTLVPEYDGLGAAVEVRLRGGETVSAEAATPLGQPGRPLTDEQRLAKWERVAGPGGSEALERCLAIAAGPFGSLVDELQLVAR